jgi:hypothetical protein
MAKRPRDPNQLAKMIVDIATGDAHDAVSPKMRAAETAKGHSGGIRGGEARAKKLPAQRRSEIAQKAARTRWRKES